MKIVPNKFLVLVLVLFSVALFAGPTPPAPTSKSTSTAKVAAPPPPSLPIGRDLYVLVLGGILLGFYTVYTYNLNTKKPV